MFKTGPATEPAPVEVALDELIPLSVLELDLPAPTTGWASHLADRDIEIVLDDLGRAAITRADAKQLFDEQREAEARQRELAEQRDREAMERERAFRAALPKGVPCYELPAGMSPADALMRTGLEAERPRSVYTTLLYAELSGRNETWCITRCKKTGTGRDCRGPGAPAAAVRARRRGDP
jgi:hypothetical protein